jgi:glyoxylase-like metal-dependent hydrolase (beta-lactamase superfamily II)
VRAVSLHRDVLVVTSALLQVNCVIVRGGGEEGRMGSSESQRADESRRPAETFVIDSPVLPEELDALPSLIEQARFPAPSGLLATHGDWDHLLGRLAFPGLALGCAQSTAERLSAEPGAAQRELRSFDEDLYIERARPLALGSVQGLPVPGRCQVGELDLELHTADGHTVDGMVIWIGWAGVLVLGDYLSTLEIPMLYSGAGALASYLATLERLRPLVLAAEHVVPGHGPVLSSDRALDVLAEDHDYLLSLREHGEAAELPRTRRSMGARSVHAANALSATSR